jgi:hypothetical protein
LAGRSSLRWAGAGIERKPIFEVLVFRVWFEMTPGGMEKQRFF